MWTASNIRPLQFLHSSLHHFPLRRRRKQWNALACSSSSGNPTSLNECMKFLELQNQIPAGVLCTSFIVLRHRANSVVWLDNKFALTLSHLMLHICRVSKTFGEWYQKTNKTEDTTKLTLLAVRRQSNNAWQLFCDRFLKSPLLTVSRSFMNVANRVVVKDGDYFEGQ
jgi:hypothetical protein